MIATIPRTAMVSVFAAVAVSIAVACSADRPTFEQPSGTFDDSPEAGAEDCPFQCSLDGRSVVRSCTGEVVETCSAELACGAARCQAPCAAAADEKSSNGCEFMFTSPVPFYEAADSCFAAFVTNASTQPAELWLERAGKSLDIAGATFQTAPGSQALTPHAGAIAAGESVVVFLSGRHPDQAAAGPYSTACPSGVVPAVYSGLVSTVSEIGSSFQLRSSHPVTVAAVYPFGGASSYVPTATLVAPVVTFAKEHLIVSPWERAIHDATPNTQIIAAEDGTEITIVGTRDIQGGQTVKGMPAKVPATYRLDKGQYLQLVQSEELTGSIVTSNKPTTVFTGHACADIPVYSDACDALWQHLPSFEEWGSEYATVGYRSRYGDEHEPMPYRIVAARDGTRLEYDPRIPAGAPTELSAGQVATFPAGTGDAFVVRSQDNEHPFYMAAYMTCARQGYFAPLRSAQGELWGDPDFVNVVPAGQYLSSYTFYADTTYSETSLVIIRAKSHGEFEDVWLECAGNLTDFQPIGTRGEYEFTRIDLTKNLGPGQSFGDKTCQSGVQRMRSDGPFTATIWGWDMAASYAYPGGRAHRQLVTTPLAPVR